MAEPYLLSTNNGNSTIAQPPQSWQNEFSFSTTTTTPNHNTGPQLFESDTVDLSKSHLDVVKDEFDVYLNEVGLNVDPHSLAYNAAHSKYQTKPHTLTTDQTTPLDLHGIALPNPTAQTLPQITVAQIAKENVIASKGNGASNDLLDSLDDAANWVEYPDVVNHFFNNRHTEQLPKPIAPTATTTADDLKWENIFGVIKQNQPGPSGITSHQPREVLTMFTRPTVYGNHNQPVPIAARNRPSLPDFINVNTTRNYETNQPGPSLVTTYQPRQILAKAVGHGPIIEPPTVNATLATPNGTPIGTNQQPNQPGPNLVTTYQPREILNNVGGHCRIITPRPHSVNATLAAPNGTLIDTNTKRKHTATIPIKIVRSTEQYATLIEMGFPKKDIEIALRKCNLDLHETIEYLSEPKRAAKKRKIDQNDLNPFHADLLNAIQQSLQQPNIQQSHDQPPKVDAEPAKKPANLYEELLQLEETGGIVKSIESFDCEICMDTIEMKDGMILRNCLHRYCKDCLNGTIVHSEEISIKCPYVNCDEMVQDREIRAVLSQDEYEKFLMKGVRVAQVTISGTILCNLPDCNGWCICEDVVNEFKCPQCKNVNCIPCKAIHPNRNCREYQDDLAAGDANGIISGQRRSEQAIQDLINRNEAMKCFNCGILIMKRDGCDYIQCVMCKAGICWATRGPRYGPGGVGDFSGGCQCSSQKKCHENCRGCH